MATKAELCKSCIHTNVCFKDKNLFGDIFISPHLMFFDTTEAWEKYEKRKTLGFPCNDYLQIISCKDCKYSKTVPAELWNTDCDWMVCSLHKRTTKEDNSCSWVKRREEND